MKLKRRKHKNTPRRTTTERPKQWVKTTSELAVELNISRSALHRYWVNKQGFPAKIKKGWPVGKCQAFIRGQKEQQAQRVTGTNAEAKRTKLELECEILTEKLAILKGESIPVKEHRSVLAEQAGIVCDVFEQWIQYVEAISRDPLLVQKARDLENRMRSALREKVGE